MKTVHSALLMTALTLLASSSAFSMGKKPIVAGVQAYRPMSFDIDSTAETILCEGERHYFAFAGGSEKTAKNVLLVLDKSSGSSKLYENIYFSEGAGWTYRDLDRSSNMDRLRGFIEDPIQAEQDSSLAGLPVVQHALEFRDPQKTALAKRTLESVTEDLPIKQVSAQIYWKNKARSTTTSFALGSANEAAACITVDAGRLPLTIAAALQKRFREHALIRDLYGITQEGRRTCLDGILRAESKYGWDQEIQCMYGDPEHPKSSRECRDEVRRAALSGCIAEIEASKESVVQAFIEATGERL